MQVPPHVEQAAVALDDVKLLYVPVPKAASTAILWALAESEGIADETFLGSTKLEVTRALAAHGGDRRSSGAAQEQSAVVTSASD